MLSLNNTEKCHPFRGLPTRLTISKAQSIGQEYNKVQLCILGFRGKLSFYIQDPKLNFL